MCRYITDVCSSFCTLSLPRGGQQHLCNPSVCVNDQSTCSLLYAAAPVFLTSWLSELRWHEGTPKALRGFPFSYKMSLLLPKGSIRSSLRLSTLLISQLHATLWVCGCTPCVIAPLHAYLSTPVCKYLHVADLAYLALFHAVPLRVFMTLKALIFPARLLRFHSLLRITVVFPFGFL